MLRSTSKGSTGKIRLWGVRRGKLVSLRGPGQRRESVREVGGSRDGVIPKKSLLSTEEYHVLSEKLKMVSIRGQPWFMRPESSTQ